MANKKVTDLDPITTAPISGVMHFVDTTDSTQNAAGSSFKVTKEDFLKENTAAILLNTAKVGISTGQVSAIVLNTEKVGYTEALVNNNTKVLANESALLLKTDKGAFTGTSKDLENLIVASSTGASGISIVPTSPTPTGTGIASFTATQAGTYVNFGGVVVNTNSFGIISRDASGAFTISQTPLNLTQYAEKSTLNGGAIAQTLSFSGGGISAANGSDFGGFEQARTGYISLSGFDFFNYAGLRGFEGPTYSMLSIYDINQVFIASLVNCTTNGAIFNGSVNIKENYPTAKFLRLAVNNNGGFIAGVSLDLGTVGLISKLQDNTTNIALNVVEIQNAKDLTNKLEDNKVNRILQKQKLYTENLVSSANITTSNAQTLNNFHPAIVNGVFDITKYRTNVAMKAQGVNFPQPFFAVQDVERRLGFTIEFNFTGQFLEIAGRETFYFFTLVINDVVVVKNFNSATSTVGYDAFGRLWTKINLGGIVTNANVKIFMSNSFAGVSMDGSIFLNTDKRLKIIADGDSIFEGTGAAVAASNNSVTNIYSMIGVLSYILDLDLYDAAVGGSGFIATGNGGEPNMVNRFDTYISPYPCDIFISGGGLNDGYTTYSSIVEAAVDAYFVKINDRYRGTNTRVVIVTPYEPNGATKDQHLGILGIRDREKVLCLQYGFVFIDMIDGKSFDEIGNLVQDSSTTLGGITDDGRAATFYFDGTHPNEAGHQYAGKRILAELYRLLR